MPTAQELRALVENDIGGGIVLRPFNFKGAIVTAGERLTEDDVRAIRHVNRKALVAGGKLHVLSKGAGAGRTAGTQAFAVHRGGGKYDVIEGVRINDEPLSKEEAESLAGADTRPN